MADSRPFWSRCVIAAHLAVFVLAGYALALSRSDLSRLLLSLISGTSLFVLTSLVHEASHYNLARRPWLNDLFGNLAGYLLGTPLSAYRALHMKHHQTTNRDDDPFTAFNTRWMILFGAPTAIALAHTYAWRHFRGRAFARYLVETCGIARAGGSHFRPAASLARVVSPRADSGGRRAPEHPHSHRASGPTRRQISRHVATGPARVAQHLADSPRPPP